MKKYSPMHSTIDLDDAYCQNVIDAAIALLDSFGIRCASKKVKSYMHSFPGIRVCDETIQFDQDMLHAHVYAIGQQEQKAKDDYFQFGQPWCCLNLADYKEHIIRSATEEDLIDIVKFMDAFNVPGNVPPVALSDYPTELRDLHGTRVCLENSLVYGAPTHTPSSKELPFYREMAEIAQRPIWMLAMLVNNPMRFDDRVLEFVIDNKDCQQFAIEMVGGLPAIGSTSPMSFPAAHVQGMAEDLAAAFFMHTITGKYPPPYLRGDPFDMKYANYRIGGPEYILLDMANRRLHEYITHTPRSWGYLLSMAKWPDQQATFERTIGCWNQAMNGATFFKGSGQLSSDEIFSVEQVVIDREIVKSAEHVCKGLQFDSDFAQVPSIIQEGLEEGHYLMHETTLNSFRDFFYDTKLFGGTNLGQWRAGGEKTVLEQAHEIVQSVRNNHTFVLENDARTELQVVCKRAEEVLL